MRTTDNVYADRIKTRLGENPRIMRLLKYILVGVTGVVINEALLYAVTGLLGFSYLIGGTVGRVVSTSANYVINDRWTWDDYGDDTTGSFLRRAAKYGVTRIVGIGIGLGALYVFVTYAGLHYLLANLLSIGVGLLWGFGTSDLWVWQTDDAPYFQGKINAVQERIDRKTQYVLALATALFVLFSAYTILLYNGYWSTGGDLGAYAHMFTTTLNGQGLLNHGKFRVSHPGESYWGAHFTLTLFAFLPVYALYQSPITLLVVKSAVLAGSIPVLWVLARRHLEDDRVAGFLTLSYAFNPFLWEAWTYDFQEQILLPLLIFGAYGYLEQKRWSRALILIALALLTNEFVVLLVFGFAGALIIDAYRAGELQERAPVIGTIFGMAVAVRMLAGWVTNQFSEIAGIPIWAVADPFHPYIETYRTGVSDLIGVLLANPTLIPEVLAFHGEDKAVFFVLLFVPVLFLALSDEITLGTLAPFVGFAWVVAGGVHYYTFGAHYPLYLLPFIYIGAIRAANRIDLRKYASKTAVTRIFATVLVLNVLVIGGFALDVNGAPRMDEHTSTLDEAIDNIPSDADLVTQNTIYPHVSTRPNAHFVSHADRFKRYEEVHGEVTPEYILIDTELDTRSVDWAQPVLDAFYYRLGTEYQLYQYEDGIWIFKEGYTGEPKGVTGPYNVDTRQIASSTFSVISGEYSSGEIIGNTGSAGQTVWFGPYKTLPPGQYNATFLVNTTSPQSSDAPQVQFDVATGLDHAVIANETVGETDGWEEVTLEFTLTRTTRKVEFRGIQAGGAGTVRFQHATLAHEPLASTTTNTTSTTSQENSQ